MLFSIAMALMVVLVAGFWTYQGFFSSAIMFFECVIASLAAFGFCDPLGKLLADTLGASLSRGLAFGVLFLGVLFILRYLTDRYFKENLRVNQIADRAGAGVFGFLSGLLLVGNALVCVQMLPIGADIFGFNRVKAKPDGTLDQSGFLLGPDAFSVKMASWASSGGLGGSTALGKVKPDLLLDLYSARNAVQTEDRIDIPENGIKVNAYWDARSIDSVKQKLDGTGLVREFETREVTNGKLLVCDITVDKSACLKDKNEIYLRVQQFRIIGPPPESGHAPHEYLAVGMSDLYFHRGHNWPSISDQQSTRLVRFGPETDFFLGSGQTKEVADTGGKKDDKNAPILGWHFDVAFEVPEDFEPWYVAFKNGARAEVSKQKFKPAPPKGASVALGNTGPGRTAGPPPEKPTKAGKPQGGTTHIANAIEERTGVFDDLPMVLSRKDQVVSGALKGSKLGDCHFSVEVPDKAPPSGQAVSKFSVPEGKKMVQIGAEKNFPGSMFGKALNYASNTVGQVTISTEDGKDYVAQGVYAAAPVNGKMTIEIQYIEDADTSDLRLKAPKKVTSNLLQNTPKEQRKFGYLFIVDPGVKITGFKSGGMGSKQTMNIEVPS
jgi:hypothetical protein